MNTSVKSIQCLMIQTDLVSMSPENSIIAKTIFEDSLSIVIYCKEVSKGSERCLYAIIYVLYKNSTLLTMHKKYKVTREL